MKVTRYMIRANENYGKGRRIIKEFKTKAEAKSYIKKLTAKGKINSYGIRLTSFRNAQSGVGIKNPRIVKRNVLR